MLNVSEMPVHDASVMTDANSTDGGTSTKVVRIKALSLDQCFLSLLALNPKHDADIARLKSVLLDAVASQKLVVPSHINETVFESSLLPASRRDAVLSLQAELSCDAAFLSFEDILRCETLALVRPTVPVSGYRVQPLRIALSADLQAVAKENRKAKTEVVSRINRVPYPPKSYQPNHGHEDIFRSLGVERSASMRRIVEEILHGKPLSDGSKVWEYAEGVGEFLLSEQITRIECCNLLEKIRNRDWEMMPIVGFHTALWAKIEQDILKTNRTFKVNDFIDILRLTVALLYADAAACDNPMKELLRQTKLDVCVAVFSMRDVRQLTHWVETL
jgi:hypothetical protein